MTDVLLLTPQRQERLSDCSALLELERKVRNRRGVLTQPPGPRTTRFLTVSLPPLSRASLASTGLPRRSDSRTGGCWSDDWESWRRS